VSIQNATIAILITGLVAGVMSGMFGIGGGLVIVPALVILFGLDQKTATGTSLFALLLPVGLLAVIDYRQQGKMRFDYGLLIAPGLLIGALVGSKINRLLSDLMLKRVYAGFLIIVAAYYLLISTERGRSWVFARSTAAKPAAQSHLPSELS
jgi:uncharacterized protein